VNDELLKDVEGSGCGLMLTYCPAVYLEGLWKTTKYLIGNSRSPGQDLNHGSPEYKAGVLPTRPRRLVRRKERLICQRTATVLCWRET
jgi:hypothetical protein